VSQATALVLVFGVIAVMIVGARMYYDRNDRNRR
jgi:hypothetical protein